MICAERQLHAVPNFGTIHRMVEPTDLKRRLRDRDKTQADLARYLDKSPQSISRLVDGQRRMSAIEEKKIAEFLGEPPRAPSGRIPLYGFVSAAAQPDRIAVTSDRVLEWLEPPDLRGKTPPNAAWRVADESMAPRLFAGEVVYGVTGLPPARNQDCVIEFTDDTVMIKTYVKQDSGYLFVRQFNPDKELRFRWDEVRAIHAVTYRG